VLQGAQAAGAVRAVLCICSPLEGLSTKARQYMYVNGRYVQGDAASKLLNTLCRQVIFQCTLVTSSTSFVIACLNGDHESPFQRNKSQPKCMTWSGAGGLARPRL
jgi:DNA mismatch repair ATPase MutL